MNRKKLIITAIILVLILIIGGILAYFTDVETKTNKFKMGGANITVTEESFPGDENNTVDIVPGQEVAKDPVVTNVGDGTVYAFVEVTIPKASVKIGNQASASVQELFTTKYISDATTTPETYSNGINPGWVLLSSDTSGANSNVYVYAYGTKADASSPIVLTGLTKNQATPAVFDSVVFADVKEDSNTPAANSIQGNEYNVVVTGYGIQSEGLGTTDAATIFGYAKNN